MGKPEKVSPNEVICDRTTKARYVKIALTNDDESLYLNEVEIMSE